MELNDILKLVNAGYTRADIEAMTAAPAPVDHPADPEPEPAPAPVDHPADPEPEPAPAPAQPDPEQAPAVNDDRYDRLEKLLTTLIGAQQGMNVNADIGAADVNKRTPEQILGSVIAPPRKEKK